MLTSTAVAIAGFAFVEKSDFKSFKCVAGFFKINDLTVPHCTRSTINDFSKHVIVTLNEK